MPIKEDTKPQGFCNLYDYLVKEDKTDYSLRVETIDSESAIATLHPDSQDGSTVRLEIKHTPESVQVIAF